MREFIVTVRISRNPDHDPHNKVRGVCPMSGQGVCTDITGEHHSTLMTVDYGPEILADELRKSGLHVTRIEEVL